MLWRSASRADTLSAMGELRRLARRERRDRPGEDRILEIAEVAYILRADGLSEPQIFERLALVYGTPPPAESGDLLADYLVEHLRTFDPQYLDLHRDLFRVALQVACLWAEMHAVHMVRSSWPPPDMLSQPWCIGGNTGIIRTVPKGGDRRKMKPFPTFTRSLADLDILLTEYRGEAAAVVRRMKARAVPGDVLCGYSTGARSWRALMGSSGIALVREGRSIDHVETMMN